MKRHEQQRFAICISNDDSEDLELRKVYIVLPDESAASDGYIRVVDESGEDYLYPESRFIVLDLPEALEDALASVIS